MGTFILLFYPRLKATPKRLLSKKLSAIYSSLDFFLCKSKSTHNFIITRFSFIAIFRHNPISTYF